MTSIAEIINLIIKVIGGFDETIKQHYSDYWWKFGNWT